MESFEFVIWDENLPCSDGDRILLAGFNIDNFLKNPIVYFNHSYANRYEEDIRSKVIGKVISHRYDESKLLMSVVFDMEDSRAAEIARKVKDGFLHAVSIGYIPIAMDDSLPYINGQRNPTTTEAEMKELSIVERPAHPNAIRQKNYIFQTKTANRLGKKMEEEIKSLAENVKKLTETVEKLVEKSVEKPQEKTEEKTAGVAELEEKIKALETKIETSGINAKDLLAAIKSQGATGVNDDRSTWTVFDWKNKDADGLRKLEAENPKAYSEILKKVK